MRPDPFGELCAARSRGEVRGLYSVCSSHPIVLEAAVRRAAATGLPVLVEATANQVNQEGGYTGMKPADYAVRLRALCESFGVGEGMVVFGGDHLGPHPWRNLPAEEAMAQAEVLVRSFVSAGARKIHLDASMALGGDRGAAPEPEVAAARAVRLCAAAEDEYRSLASRAPSALSPVYVIGTEVPVPGGVKGEETGPVPTSGEAFLQTLALHERLFAQAGLGEAWKRVIAVVVQPGVEFDSSGLSPYRRERASGLKEAIASKKGIYFEGHSTDYQSDEALRELVEDGFAFLKVGPALSFALREALLGLSRIESELSGRGGECALAATLRRAMRDDKYWKGYFAEDDSIALLYSLSDRVRYYWDRPEVASEVERLFGSLSGVHLAPGLLSQFLPRLGGPHKAIGLGKKAGSRDLAIMAVDAELARYEAACFPGDRK
jgi:D-tagatose-bisphosphate aldolase class II non-catalytic subunit